MNEINVCSYYSRGSLNGNKYASKVKIGYVDLNGQQQFVSDQSGEHQVITI
jgi:hypothetical protein